LFNLSLKVKELLSEFKEVKEFLKLFGLKSWSIKVGNRYAIPNYKEFKLSTNPTINKCFEILSSFDNEELTKKNLFPIYNFTKKRIIKEKEILELLTNESTIKVEGKLITPKIRFQNADLKIETLFFSQIIILNKLINPSF